MSARYYDVGAGPHDIEPREDGMGTCGCRHDGTEWLSLCLAARREWQLTHDAAALEHAARIATVGVSTS
jgi:hypothetical protein